MNKKIIALILAAAIPTAVFAAKSESGMYKHNPQARMERLSEKLDLTDEQKTRLEVMFEEQRVQRKAMREAMRTKMHANMAEVLDDEQMQKMTEMHENRKNRKNGKNGKGHGRHGHGHGHGKGQDRDCGDNKSS